MDKSNKSKVWASLTLAALLVVGLAGCGSTNPEDNNTGTQVQPPAEGTLKPDAVPGSGGTADSGNAGGQVQNSAGGLPPPPDK